MALKTKGVPRALLGVSDISPSDLFNFFQLPRQLALFHDCFFKLRKEVGVTYLKN